MESEIIHRTKDMLVIGWTKPNVGFGELTMEWDQKTQLYKLDSECMGIDTVIEIFKALPPINE